MNNLSWCCQAEKRYSESGCYLCWTCTKCNQFGGCDNFPNRIGLSNDFFKFNVSTEPKTMTKIKDITEDMEKDETETKPELSHGGSDDTPPSIPPDDDNDDDDEEEDFKFEFEMTKEHNRNIYRQNKLKVELYQAQTDRIDTLHNLLEGAFTNKRVISSRYTLLNESDLELPVAVKQAKERFIVTLYDQLGKEIKNTVKLKEED